MKCNNSRIKVYKLTVGLRTEMKYASKCFEGTFIKLHCRKFQLSIILPQKLDKLRYKHDINTGECQQSTKSHKSLNGNKRYDTY